MKKNSLDYKKIALISRTFWPENRVVGAGILCVAEELVKRGAFVKIITQSNTNIKVHFDTEKRGAGVSLCQVWCFTSNANKLLFRGIDSLIFAIFVFFNLIRTNPSIVYISTDPPIFVPFLTCIYCRLFKKPFIFHVQDIHPEATNIVVPLNRYVFRILRWMDSFTMRSAKFIITLNEVMKTEVVRRSSTLARIEIISNPSISFAEINTNLKKLSGITFCGNLGRLQRIPLLMEAIGAYLAEGGKIKFFFAGTGFHSNLLIRVAKRHANFHYLGAICPEEAAKLTAKYEWALLPIEDEVTKYAFPSKTSAYILSGSSIVTICGPQTTVAKWVKEKNLGIVVDPTVIAIKTALWGIEQGTINAKKAFLVSPEIKKELSFEHFASAITKLINSR